VIRVRDQCNYDEAESGPAELLCDVMTTQYIVYRRDPVYPCCLGRAHSGIPIMGTHADT